MKKQPTNPYLPSWEYIPDGEPYVFGDRLYIYGSHDKFGGEDFCVGDYAGWSAPLEDLSDWRYEGIIYKREQDPFYDDSKDQRLFAPDCQRGPDGRYYLYYAFTREGIIGVAVCDTPAGQYEYYGHVHYAEGTLLGRREEDMFQYDPGVLVDDDGRVYLYSGFCPNVEKIPSFKYLKPNPYGAMAIELEPDMVTVKKDAKFIVPCEKNAAGTGYEGHSFFEASSIRKIGETYYFIYSSELGHELCYAVSNRPDGGFRYGGTIISNGDIGYQGRTEPLNYTGTNHGSIEYINGEWFVFYHRQTNGSPYSRQGCADKIEILPDGSIPQIRMTSQGLNAAALPGIGEYGAGIACCLMGPDGACNIPAHTKLDDAHPRFTQEKETEADKPYQYIRNLRDGAAAGYRFFDMKRLRKIAVCVRGDAEGKLLVSVSPSGEAASEIPIARAEQWSNVEASFSVPDGERELWFTYKGDGALSLKSFELLS